MSTNIAVLEIKYDYISEQLAEILAHVKDTNGKVHEHSVELAEIREWRKAVESWRDDMSCVIKKMDTRLWLFVAGSTIIGTVVGIISNSIIK